MASILCIPNYSLGIHRLDNEKINSIGYGHKIIGSAAICLIIVPTVCYLLWAITKQAQFLLLIKASLVLGFMILLFLFVLLKIEFYQDKKTNKYFKANTKIRLPLKNGLFECQTCGNNQIKPEQKSCTVCGINFRNWSEDGGNKKQQ